MPWRVALGATFVVLALLVWLPIDFDPNWFLVDCGLGAGLSAFAASRIPVVVRALAGTRRMTSQVNAAAEAAFTSENVHATRGRTGVLVYVSALEGQVRVLPDHGLLGRIPPSRFAALALRADSLDTLLVGLRSLGELLAEHLPSVEGDNPNETPDTPRVRP